MDIDELIIKLQEKLGYDTRSEVFPYIVGMMRGVITETQYKFLLEAAENISR
jgi:hypothetical protein